MVNVDSFAACLRKKLPDWSVLWWKLGQWFDINELTEWHEEVKNGWKQEHARQEPLSDDAQRYWDVWRAILHTLTLRDASSQIETQSYSNEKYD